MCACPKRGSVGHEARVVVGGPGPHPLLQRGHRQLQDGVAGHGAALARLAPPWTDTPIAPPSPESPPSRSERLAGLATPPGALGRIGELGAWLAAVQGEVPPRPLTDVRLVVFAGDHGVAAHGVSAYPAAVTEAMVRTIVAGRAGVSALAREHGVAVTVLDIAVDADLADLPAEVTARKVRRGSGRDPPHRRPHPRRDRALARPRRRGGRAS